MPALEAALLKQKVPLKYINGINGILISIQKQLSLNPVKHWALCLQLLLPKLYTIYIILGSFLNFMLCSSLNMSTIRTPLVCSHKMQREDLGPRHCVLFREPTSLKQPCNKQAMHCFNESISPESDKVSDFRYSDRIPSPLTNSAQQFCLAKHNQEHTKPMVSE